MESYSSEEKIYWGHKEPVVSPSEKDLGKNITKSRGKAGISTQGKGYTLREQSQCAKLTQDSKKAWVLRSALQQDYRESQMAAHPFSPIYDPSLVFRDVFKYYFQEGNVVFSFTQHL